MKNEKRFLSVFLSVTLFFCSLFTLSVSSMEYKCVIPLTETIYKEATVGDVTAKCGEKVIVTLELDSIYDSVTVVASLPDGITCENVVDNSGNQLETVNDDVALEFIMTDTKAFITYLVDKYIADGEYRITYSIKESTDYYNVVYTVYGGNFYVTGNSAVTTSAVTTTETTETTVTNTENELPLIPIEFVNGDANGDGKLTALDAAFIAKLLAQTSLSDNTVTVEDYPNADFNGDGKITALDASAIAKYLAEKALYS